MSSFDSEKQQKGSLAGVELEFQDTGATARIVSGIAFELSKVMLSLSLSLSLPLQEILSSGGVSSQVTIFLFFAIPFPSPSTDRYPRV